MGRKDIPVWQKENLTLEEAAALFNIGVNKLRAMTSSPNCDFVLFVGRKRLIKKSAFTEYLERIYSV